MRWRCRFTGPPVKRGDPPSKDKYPEIRSETCISSPIEFGDIDLARIAPRFFVRNDAAIQAIRSEIFSLLTSKNDRVSPIVIVCVDDPSHRASKKIPTSLAARLKANNMAKARLCLRGDVMKGGGFASFTSAPTADRQLLKIILTLAVDIDTK